MKKKIQNAPFVINASAIKYLSAPNLAIKHFIGTVWRK
jgi:hypothetical protein